MSTGATSGPTAAPPAATVESSLGQPSAGPPSVGTPSVGRGVRTFGASSRSAHDALGLALEHKRDLTISVCIPCRDEAATVGQVSETIRGALMTSTAPLVDELIVVDDGSVDDSARVAAEGGARVEPIGEVHAVHGAGRGKGNALWASLVVSGGDLVVWCDADLTSFDPRWIVELSTPLLLHPEVMLVKADYERPTSCGGGGRTTELVARPLLSQLFPHLAGVAQPLAGECAVRRSAVEQLTMMQGWGVEIAMLIDVAERFGPEAIAQVPLGEKRHAHQPLDALSVQAAEVLAAALERAPSWSPEAAATRDTTPDAGAAGSGGFLQRADGTRVALNDARRPPVASLHASERAVR